MQGQSLRRWSVCIAVAVGAAALGCGGGKKKSSPPPALKGQFTVQAAVTGLDSHTTGPLVLSNSLGDDVSVSGDGTVPLGSAANNQAYSVTVKTQPTPFRSCNVTNGIGTVTGDLTVTVNCSSVVIQRWEAPTTWGGLWKDDGHMVQHATFDGNGEIHEDFGIAWSVQNGTLGTAAKKLDLPGATRYGVGPFGGSGATAQRFQATGDSALGQDGDLLVCAIVKPDYGSPFDQDWGKPIIAKGLFAASDNSSNSGWALMQRHGYFSFYYKPTGLTDTGNPLQPVYTPNYFATGGNASSGPLNPTYLVVCGGRYGNNLSVRVNSISDATSNGTRQVLSGGQTLDAGTHPTTIGGWDNGSNYQFGGRIYETAVWHEPATDENIQAKFAAVEGLALNASEPGILTTYTRNREAPYLGSDGSYHTTWRHGPRIDPTRGFLFGIQGWNRLSHANANDYAIAPGEDLTLWNGGPQYVSSTDKIEPPGDSEQRSVGLVSLPNGASLSTPLGRFDNPGPIHGQIWIRVATSQTGTLHFSTSYPDAGHQSGQDLNLGTLRPEDGWQRIWLTGLRTDATTHGTVPPDAPDSFTISNTGSGDVQFYAWGIDLTQISEGGDLSSLDPGPMMYDWASSDRFDGTAIQNPTNVVDMLELPPLPASTASGGFCISAEAQPYAPAGGAALPWSSPFNSAQFIATWVDNTHPSTLAAIESLGNSKGLCFFVKVGSDSRTSCSTDYPSWQPGTKQTLTGCLGADRTVQLYANGAPIAQSAQLLSSTSVPDAAAGHVVVGNFAVGKLADTGGDCKTDTAWSLDGPCLTDVPHPWNGYVSKVLLCRGQQNCQ